MELDTNIKQKITRRVVRDFIINNPNFFSESGEKIFEDLTFNEGKHNVFIYFLGRFTLAEVIYNYNGYNHHFFGISARNPNDFVNRFIGIKNALEDALLKLLIKLIK